MQTLFIFFILCGYAWGSCPCENENLCNIISGFPKMEVFIFSLRAENAIHYDWSKVTTIVKFTYNDVNVTCLAHKHGARALSNVNIDTSKLSNSSARAEWVAQQVQFVRDNYLDGVNLDFESPVLANETAARAGLTLLLQELSDKLKQLSPNYMVSADLAWSPACIDSRCYDYAGMAAAVDLGFVMAYDERSQIYGRCAAWANSALNNTAAGVQAYLRLGVSPQKLVLGVPWYGYVYSCLNVTQGECLITEVPFRGVPCSDAAGRQANYADIESSLLPYSLSGSLWDSEAESPYFFYKDQKSGQLMQVWYDEPKSLSIKYEYAAWAGLRGVGMWNADAIDYTNANQVNAMWGPLPSKQPNSRA